MVTTFISVVDLSLFTKVPQESFINAMLCSASQVHLFENLFNSLYMILTYVQLYNL